MDSIATEILLNSMDVCRIARERSHHNVITYDQLNAIDA